MTKTRRLELIDKAAEGAELALQRLNRLTESGNPDVAARATALLILERNELEDLKALRSLLSNTPAAQLQPVPEATVKLLASLEKGIDDKIKANHLVNSGISSLTEVLRTAEAVGEMLKISV